jgi:hypothetical protein
LMCGSPTRWKSLMHSAALALNWRSWGITAGLRSAPSSFKVSPMLRAWLDMKPKRNIGWMYIASPYKGLHWKVEEGSVISFTFAFFTAFSGTSGTVTHRAASRPAKKGFGFDESVSSVTK